MEHNMIGYWSYRWWKNCRIWWSVTPSAQWCKKQNASHIFGTSGQIIHKGPPHAPCHQLHVNLLWMLPAIGRFIKLHITKKNLPLVSWSVLSGEKVLACPGTTLLALGQDDISPTVQTREPERDSTAKPLHWPSYDRKSLGCLQRLSNRTINSAAAAIGSWRMDIGTVPACPCEPLTVTCKVNASKTC